jgi:hypothetical protein
MNPVEFIRTGYFPSFNTGIVVGQLLVSLNDFISAGSEFEK